MIITDYKPIHDGHIVASFTLHLQSGLIFEGMTLIQKDKSRFVTFHSEPYEKDGQKKYWHYIKVRNDRREAFQKQCKAAIDKYLENNKNVH